MDLRATLRVPFSAVMFMTRIPVPRWVGYDTGDLARSTAYFPLIGVLVGGIGASVLYAASLVWSPFVAVVLSTSATVWATGAFHEDALADSCDGFGGGWEREQVLTIMKDSRIGSYGAVGLVLVLLAKTAALVSIVDTQLTAGVRALIIAHTLGRWSSLPLIWALPYVSGDGSKSRPFAASVTTSRLVVGSLLALATVVLAYGIGNDGARIGLAAPAVVRALPAIAAVVVVAVIITFIAARYFTKRIGGMTGDCLGAANQMVELFVYLTLASTWLRR